MYKSGSKHGKNRRKKFNDFYKFSVGWFVWMKIRTDNKEQVKGLKLTGIFYHL